MTLKIGIIGLGVGEAHIAGYHRHSKAKVVALCDFDQAKLKNAKKKYPNLKLTAKANDILKDPEIDAVSIASYDHFHYDQIVMAIEHGKHIFVEKPLCLYRKHAVDIRRRLSKSRLRMSSNLILRKTPRFAAVKKMITAKKMGKLYYIEGDYNYGRIEKITGGWRGSIPFYSIVYGGGVHLIDLFWWLTKDPIVEVTAVGNQLATKGSKFRCNDCVAALLKFKSGMIGKMTANFGCMFPHFHVVNLYGTKATFLNDLYTGRLFTSREKGALPILMKEDYPGVHKGDLIYSFVESIIKEKAPEVDANDVFRAMSVCFAIEEAVQKKTRVKVNYI